jgi:hypothetical protein
MRGTALDGDEARRAEVLRWGSHGGEGKRWVGVELDQGDVIPVGMAQGGEVVQRGGES